MIFRNGATCINGQHYLLASTAAECFGLSEKHITAAENSGLLDKRNWLGSAFYSAEQLKALTEMEGFDHE